jgi:hypothetical protein
MAGHFSPAGFLGLKNSQKTVKMYAVCIQMPILG